MGKMILAIGLVLLAAGCGPSAKQKEAASSACREFIARNMEVPEDYTQVFDVYEKKGATVVEVGYKDRSSDESFTVRLCVIDDKKGTISSPSPLDDSEWSK